MDAAKLLTTAPARTGSNISGQTIFTRAFAYWSARLTRGRDREEHRAQLEEKFVNLLVQRLRFARDIEAHPDVAQERIRSPLIIVSLPRTGSMKLHRSLVPPGISRPSSSGRQ